MAYNVTGTPGNDNLDQSANDGPGTILGLDGDDQIFTGNGLVTVDGGSGGDTVILRTGNTGTVTGGTENDSFVGGNIDSMVLFGNQGADSISIFSNVPQTIIGGNDSNDGSDLLLSGNENDIIFGNGGDDTCNGGSGLDTMIGGVGNDFLVQILVDSDADLVFGNEGNDTVSAGGGADTVFGGLGNNSVFSSGGSALYFGNEGNDTVVVNSAGPQTVTVVGGNDSADGGDSIFSTNESDVLFGNGGADTIDGSGGNNTIIGGFDGDLIPLSTGGSADFIFGNEGNDTITTGPDGPDTVFAGQGNDTVVAGSGRDTLLGNEGNDTIRGNLGIDTISGGAGADVFGYATGSDDGDNVAGGGPTELVTDVNWAEDRVQVFAAIAAAGATPVGAAANLQQAADNALGAIWAGNGSGAIRVAAQFDFQGRTYVAIDQGGAFGSFQDANDLLLDITGVVGTIGAGNFTT